MEKSTLRDGIKSAVLAYINKNRGVDYLDIQHYFAQHSTTAMCVATELADERKVEKIPGGKFFKKEAK